MSSTFDQDPDEQRFPEEEQLCIEIRFARERSLNTFANFDFVNKFENIETIIHCTKKLLKSIHLYFNATVKEKYICTILTINHIFSYNLCLPFEAYLK